METLDELLRSAPPVGRRDRPIGLVVQGGGMRGVYSMAALAALERAGFTDAFDFIVGSSAGAINASYFLAGQAAEAVRVYIDLLSNRNFVNPWRLNRIVDIDFLVATLRSKAPLDLDRISSSTTTLEAVVTNALTAEPVSFTNRDTAVDWYEVIRATSALPALYNRQVMINGVPYIDGGASDGVPLKLAVDRGCRDLISIVTRRPGFRRVQHAAPYRWVGRALARGQTDAVKALIGEEDRLYNAAMDILEGHVDVAGGVRNWVVWPSDTAKLVGRTTFRKDELEACASMAGIDMTTVLGSRPAASRRPSAEDTHR